MTPREITQGSWSELKRYKEAAHATASKLGTQLHIPRKLLATLTRRERRLKNLASPFAYDSKGMLKPDYSKYENDAPLNESMPLFTGSRSQPNTGGNKPSHGFWTSTARRCTNGTYTSEWNDWVLDNMKDWHRPVGHLYRPLPTALVLPINSSRDASEIALLFHDLGLAADYRDERHSKTLSLSDPGFALRYRFPWDAVAQHFDGVHYSNAGLSWSEGLDFTYGWDAESTVWFNTSALQYRGSVRVCDIPQDER